MGCFSFFLVSDLFALRSAVAPCASPAPHHPKPTHPPTPTTHARHKGASTPLTPTPTPHPAAKFDFNDFLKQYKMVAGMGNMAQIMKMLPGEPPTPPTHPPIHKHTHNHPTTHPHAHNPSIGRAPGCCIWRVGAGGGVGNISQIMKMLPVEDPLTAQQWVGPWVLHFESEMLPGERACWRECTGWVMGAWGWGQGHSAAKHSTVQQNASPGWLGGKKLLACARRC